MSSSDAYQSSFDLLQQHTLIITTFNRPQLLEKLLKYYASKKSKMSFLILDSSNPETIEKNRQSCAILGEKGHHLVYDESIRPIPKILAGIQSIQTPFCTFCADDDIIFYQGLAESLAYLKDHPEYACVDGVYLNYRLDENDIKILIEYSHKGLDGNHPLSRVFRLFQKYESLFYGVCRTSHVQRVFEGMNRLSSLCFQELFQSVATLLLGKKHRLPLFYAGRYACGRADPSFNKWSFQGWFGENPSEVLHDYALYRAELRRLYEQHVAEPQMPLDAFNHSMDLAHAVFLNVGTSSEDFYANLQQYWPSDPFQKVDPFNYELSEFKKAPHRLWDTLAHKALVFLQKHHKKGAALFYRNDVGGLNREIRKHTHSKRKCVPRADLKWLSTLKEFRSAYKELCIYLDGEK